MLDVVATRPVIPAMSSQAIRAVRALEERVLTLPQVPIETRHVLHAGMYARTICVPAGVLITGAHITIPTLLIVSGHATLFIGDEDVELTGYAVIPASAGRKQAIYAHADTLLTMLFPTSARTVEEAEQEFTDEPDRLGSRRAPNHVTATGE
ncbi:hypothetical protein [Reyranella sp.]|uniref:hypothetical protein n=1 Tax=Reyranella sp. TaxID=1929291 RepID=UPI003D0AADBC